MTENITLEIKEKKVHFNPVVVIKTIPNNNNGRKVIKPTSRKQKVFVNNFSRPVRQPNRFGMSFMR